MAKPEKYIKHAVGQPTLNPDYVEQLEDEIEQQRNSYNQAIEYALGLDISACQMFLNDWNEGAWKEIAETFPDFDLVSTNQCDKNGNLLVSE